MFTRRHFVEAADELLQLGERLSELYETLLADVDDAAIRLRIIRLRQDLHQRHRRVRLLRALLEH